MLRFIIPVILIGVSIITTLMLTNPIYQEISNLKAEVASYDEALTNSKALENERDQLTRKYNAIDPSNLERLEKMIPSNVDNIRLILEIERVASPYGMVLREVKYNSQEQDAVVTAEGAVTQDSPLNNGNSNYGSWDLEFSTQGTYENFVNFIKALEQNLRIVDISSIEFSSTPNTGSETSVYKYSFKIKTYWLKD